MRYHPGKRSIVKIIHLKQFGNVLVSRPAGLEALNAIRPTLAADDNIQISFDDVLTVTPSWFDEFVTRLAQYTTGTVELLPTKNASVRVALPVLLQAHDGDEVAEIFRRALTTWAAQA